MPGAMDTETVDNMLWAAFKNNPKLSGYDLQDDVFEYRTPNNEPIDGSVQNALGDFSDKLDSIHKDKLIPGSNKVIISRANFTDMNDKRMVRENYFITAPTSKDEDKILQALQDTNLFLTVRVSKNRK
jgi:hypothetical protein